MPARWSSSRNPKRVAETMSSKRWGRCLGGRDDTSPPDIHTHVQTHVQTDVQTHVHTSLASEAAAPTVRAGDRCPAPPRVVARYFHRHLPGLPRMPFPREAGLAWIRPPPEGAAAMTPTIHTPTDTDSRAWQTIVDTLERAAFACHSRGGRADDVLHDQVIWLQHCLTVEDAADALRTALPFELAEYVPDAPGGLNVSTGPAALHDLPGGSSAAPAPGPGSGGDSAPLALLERAWEDLQRLQDDSYWLGNVPLLRASFEVADALAAVRTHSE